MATASTAIWRMRPGGNAANGAGYDPGIAGAGTDYSAQNGPQLSLTDVACSANTTVTSVTGGFTAAMIGNAIKISGGGATTGHYWITARTDTNTITVDRTPGTVSGGTGKVGGASALPENLGPHVVPGNVVYILGVAGNAASYPTSSLDYATTGYFTPTAGSAAVGWVKWVGDPAGPTPTLASDGLYFYSCVYQWFENLYVTATGANVPNFGIIHASSGPIVVKNCVVNQANRAALVGINAASSVISGTEVYGGTASPTASAGSYGITTGNYNTTVKGCYIHHCRDDGINDAASQGLRVEGSLIAKCVGNGVTLATTSATITATVSRTTIDGNGGHGIAVTGTAGIGCVDLFDNILSNHAGSGKYGLEVTNGSTATNDARKRFCDYNNLYGNTGSYHNMSAGAHDLAVNPSYTSGTDWTPTNAALKAASSVVGYP